MNWNDLNNRTMFQIVYNLLEKSKKPMHFDDIWEEIKDDIINKMKDKIATKKHNKFELNKKTELYCLMTIAGDFFINKNDCWDLETKYMPKDLKKLKIKFSQNEEIVNN